MRLVIAKCSVDYVGRLSAHLPPATRLLMVKADGSVSIHADDRAYKPLNWMSPPCKLQEAPGVWKVVNKAGEELRITLEEIFQDTSYELGIDPGLVKDGVEAHLQELLAAHPETFGEGWVLVRREFMTAIGPVDLLCRDANGAAVAVEIVVLAPLWLVFAEEPATLLLAVPDARAAKAVDTVQRALYLVVSVGTALVVATRWRAAWRAPAAGGVTAAGPAATAAPAPTRASVPDSFRVCGVLAGKLAARP